MSPRDIFVFLFVFRKGVGPLYLFMTRFGESDADDWRRANHYRYRIEL
jgi:hypothetical protein